MMWELVDLERFRAPHPVPTKYFPDILFNLSPEGDAIFERVSFHETYPPSLEDE